MMKAALALFLFGAVNSCLIGDPVPNIPSISNPIPPTYNPQLQTNYPGYPQPPTSYPGYPQPPINYPGFPPLPPFFPTPTFVPGYSSYPNYPQQTSFPNFPQIPSNPFPPQGNNDYILTFDWAPVNSSNTMASSKGVVRIGNQIVADLSVTDDNIKVRHVEMSINLQNGENSISFEGTGTSDTSGISVTNVVIRSRDSSQNLLINGNFSSPSLNPAQYRYIRDGFSGWTADIGEVGDCRLYNGDWKSGQQCIELDSLVNQIYTQKFTVSTVSSCQIPYNPIQPPQIPIIPVQPHQINNDYVVTFDWAPRTNGIDNPGSSKAVVKIGDQTINLFALDGNLNVRHAEINVKLQNGENSISFEGTGDNDSFGVTINNVVVRRKDSSQNLLINGNFSSPSLASGTWQYINNGISGWTANVAEVGDCRIYNNSWRSGLQCIELDTTYNQIYTQKFTVKNS